MHVASHVPFVLAHPSEHLGNATMRATNASFLLLAATFGVLAVGTTAMDLGEGWKKGSEEMFVGGYKELEDVRARKIHGGLER